MSKKNATKKSQFRSGQAARIAAKFGGIPRLAAATERGPAVCYKWTYDRDKGGTGGLIPSSAVPDVLAAAEVLDINLTAQDWRP